MNRKIFERISKEYWNRLRVPSRRILAGVLALAMVLPMATSAMAAEVGFSMWPLQATHDSPVTSLATLSDSPDFPDIEIESNFVRDEFGFLTGYLELGLRIKPTREKSFQSLDVTLDYDTDILTPVDWSTEGKTIALGADDPAAVGRGYDYYSVKIPAQNIGEASDSSARSGWPETPIEGLTDGVKDHSRALLTFGVRYDTPEDNLEVTPDGMTTVAVIRFKLKDDFKDKIKIKKVTGSSDEYEVYYDGVLVENLFQLKEVMEADAGDTTNPGDGSGTEGEDPDGGNSGTGDGTEEGGVTTRAANTPTMELFRFANDGDMDLTDPFSSMALHYESDFATSGITFYKREYYYTEVVEEIEVTEEYNGQNYTLKKSAAKRQMNSPAIDIAAAEGDANKYSYLTNLIYNPLTDADKGERLHINFTVASKRSFVDNSNYDMTTIVYVDWDNTLLGTQSVPKGKDVRGLVSDYVAENFIYHDADEAYGDYDIYDPAQTAARDNVTLEEVVSSLERKYSYRGDYPFDGPQPDGTTANTVEDGESFPLSNKLDYVFFKRPMTHPDEPDPATYSQGKDDPQYKADMEAWAASNEWVQKSIENTTGGAGDGTSGVSASWDTEHPYAYGWAKCTVDNYGDIWTTLGMGELASYSGASNGGYQNMDGAPATLTYAGTTTSRLEFADLEKGFGADENTVFLKAVYEPGTELQTTDNPYRMISEPYYNKLNNVSASNGGAYSADVTFERSSAKNLADESDTRIRGVARIRLPVVRQDTTVDLRWETFEKDGEVKVDHDLPNANLEDTYSNKNKSIFTKVDVENKDEVPFSLTLTARQNRADYYLKDSYGYNFVAGGDRTEGDINRSGTAATMDNYNYFVDGENESGAVYAAVPYASREGSRGFVLTGTLNQLLQLATQCYNEEITEAEFNQYADIEVFNDINIKTADGEDPSLLNRSALRRKVLDAGKEIVMNHQGDSNYWDNVHDCAQLTYHQLQLYIMGRGLLSRDAADAVIIGHCHLHTDCVASVSNKPTTWGELIDAARNNPDHITELTGTEAETLAHLRKDSDGTAYGADVAGFRDAVKDAVAALDAAAGTTTVMWTWDQVQAQILGDDPADAPDTYWWYDGSSSVPLNNWSDLMAASKDSIEAVTLPDGTSSTRDAKLNRLESAWTDNDAAATTDRAWVRITENLCITVGNDEGQKFATFAAFKTALKNALAALPQGIESTWYEVQYHILHGTVPNPAGEEEYSTYWWHNGGVQIRSFAELMQAVEMASQGDTTSLDSFTLADLYNETYLEFHFRNTFSGTKYTDIDDFKRDMMDYYMAETATPSWVRAQYYLLHKAFGSNSALRAEGEYYWWENNGQPQPVSFDLSQGDAAGRADALAVALMDAAFRANYNGNTAAWDNLEADFAAVMESGRLVANSTGTEANYPADFTMFGSGDEAALESKIISLMQAISSNVYPPAPKATWHEIQYYILNGSYSPDETVQGGTDYWWKTEDEKPVDQPKPWEDFATFTGLLAGVADGSDSDASILLGWLTPEKMTNMGFYADEMQTEIDQDLFDSITWDALDYAGAGCLDTGDFVITWSQIQNLFLNYFYLVGDWWLDDVDTSDMNLTDFGIDDPSVSWPSGVSLMVFQAPRPMMAATYDAIQSLTEQINALTEEIAADPAKAEEYAQQIADLLAAVDALKRALDGTSQKVEETEIPTETQEPVESEEPIEPPMPTESAKPTESPDPTESAEPAPTPEPSESVPATESNAPDGSTEDKEDNSTDDKKDEGDSGTDISPNPPSTESVVPPPSPEDSGMGDNETDSDETEKALNGVVETRILDGPEDIGGGNDDMSSHLTANITYVYRRALERKLVALNSFPFLRGPDTPVPRQIKLSAFAKISALPLISSANRRISV